jgi:hypothetical protein
LFCRIHSFIHENRNFEPTINTERQVVAVAERHAFVH